MYGRGRAAPPADRPSSPAGEVIAVSEANGLLREHRERTPSAVAPGECLSRQELADRVNTQVERATGRPGALDANYIGKLERGVISWPRDHYRAAFRAVLGIATDRELGFTRPVRSGPTGDIDLLRRGGLVEAPVRPAGHPLAAAVPLLPMGFDDPLTDGMAALESMAPHRDAPPRGVSADHVHGLRSAAAMFASMDHGHGGADVHAVASVYLQHAARLLQVPCPPRLRPELLAALGWLGHVVGFTAFDAVRHRQANEAFQFALACAKESGDWNLRGKILSSMAREATWRGDPDSGLTCTELALVRSDRLTATERAMLLTARARALALLGRVAEAVETVRASDREFEHSRPESDPPWMKYYDLAQHLGDTGHALFDLAVRGHEGHEARARLSGAVDGHHPHYARSRGMSRAKLATLTLMAGDVGQAAEIGRQALHDLDTVHSARATQCVIELERSTETHRTVEEVVGLRKDIRRTLAPA